ncbi:substrate-binding domain-containing protein [Arcobacter cloacae]|nr:substrate-binding domain-containing protein [Arcobacter cloacae]
MLKKMIKILILILIVQSNSYGNNKEELIFYVGITMVKPIDLLAKEFEKEFNCRIKILQGGSQDLYNSIKSSKIGDLYLPGSLSYRTNNLDDGLLLDGQFVGFNKLSFIVKKGNPKNIKSSLDELTNEDLSVVLGNDQSGSVGLATKKLLKKFNLYEKAIMNATFLATDSRNLISAIKENKADLTLNWHATIFWDGNKEFAEAILLDENLSSKSKLVINLLKTSKNPLLAKKFMDFASSQRGRDVFKDFGFLNENELKDFDKVTF